MKGKHDIETTYTNESINRYRFRQHKSANAEGTHRHDNWEGFRERDVMKEETVVKKDRDDVHLGKGGLVEKGDRCRLEKVIKLPLLGAYTFRQHTEGKRCQHSPLSPI